MDNNYKVVTFQDDEKKLEILVSEDTNEIWLTIDQMVELFSKSKRTIYRYIEVTYKTYNYDLDQVCVNLAHELSKSAKKNAKCYPLEFVIKLGNLLNSSAASTLKNRLNEYEMRLIDTHNDTIVYNNGVVSIDVTVSPLEETVWLSQEQIALLFGRDRSVITKHISNILKEGELDVDSICAKNAHMPDNSNRNYDIILYSLDMVLAIGYRVSGARAIAFRKWVSSVLKHYLIKGYAIDESRIIASNSFTNLANRVSEIEDKVAEINHISAVKDSEEIVFFQDQFFDAYELLCSFIAKAKEQIIVIDPYFDLAALKLFRKAREGVRIKVVKSSKSKLLEKDVEAFEKQYCKVEIIINNTFHDRYLIVDNKKCYLIGASLNYIGKKTFSVMEWKTKSIIKKLIASI